MTTEATIASMRLLTVVKSKHSQEHHASYPDVCGQNSKVYQLYMRDILTKLWRSCLHIRGKGRVVNKAGSLQLS